MKDKEDPTRDTEVVGSFQASNATLVDHFDTDGSLDIANSVAVGSFKLATDVFMSLTFLYNAVRERVQLPAGEPLQKALSDFCSRKGLDVSRHVLTHNGQTVDTSLPMRLSGLIANAVVEVVVRKDSHAANTGGDIVRVALSVAGGARLEVSVTSAATLSSILAAAFPLRAESLSATGFAGASIITHTRKTVSGDSLATTTLSSLGIFKGSVSFRAELPREDAPSPMQSAPPDAGIAVVARDTSAPEVLIAASAPSTSDADVAMSEAVSTDVGAGQSAAAAVSSTVGAPSVMPPDDPVPTSDVNLSAEHADEVEAISLDPHEIRMRNAGKAARSALSALRETAWDADAAAALTLVIKILDNIVSRPGDARVRTIRLANASFHATVGRFKPAVDILLATGFSVSSSAAGGEPALVLDESNEDVHVIVGVRNLVAFSASAVGATVPPTPDVTDAVSLLEQLAAARAARQTARAAAAWDPFAPMRVILEENGSANSVQRDAPPSAAIPAGRGGAAMGGMSTRMEVIRNDVDTASSSPLSKAEEKLAALRARRDGLLAASNIGPHNRSTRVILFDSERAATASTSPRDDSLATAAPMDDDDKDVFALHQKRMKREKEEREKAQGFRTAAQRELDELSKASVATSVLIRVQLPDRTLLEGNFGPFEPGSSIHEWVRSCLLEPSQPFRLFTTPPPVQLAANETRALFDLWKGAALLIHCAWTGGSAASAQSVGTPLSVQEVLAAHLLVSASEARVSAPPPAMPSVVRIVEPEVDESVMEAAASLLLGGSAAPRVGGGGGVKTTSGGSAIPAAFSNLFKKK